VVTNVSEEYTAYIFRVEERNIVHSTERLKLESAKGKETVTHDIISKCWEGGGDATSSVSLYFAVPAQSQMPWKITNILFTHFI
jgi:hypothetical protein